MPTDARGALARGWLWLGLLALIGSGLFSVLLVLSRTPGLNRLFPVADFFRVALVVHVDLSVLVWFIALAGMLWSLNGTPRRAGWGWLALGLCGAGAALMSLAPFVGSGEPVMANYIPVLDGPLFIAGLLVFGAGVAVLVLRSLLAAPRIGIHFDGAGALRFGLNASVVATAVALGAFAWSFAVLPQQLAGKRLLRDPVLGRRPCAAVHLDAADAGGLAVAGRRLRRARAAEPARRARPVRARAGQRVRHAPGLPRVRHRLGRAPQPAHLGDAPGRRAGDPADRAGGEPGTARRGRRSRRRSGRCVRRWLPRCCCLPPAA